MMEISEGARTVGNKFSYNDPRFSDWFKHNYIYVDKSLFIREFMEIHGNILFTRPRRFGKTLNMMLLQRFLSIFDKESDDNFKALKIFQDVDFVNTHYRKYPVFLISFASTDSITWIHTEDHIMACIRTSIEPLKVYLATCNNSNSIEEKMMHQELNSLVDKIWNGSDANKVVVRFLELMVYVKRYFDIYPIVLIDEYDAPIRTANENEFLKEALGLLKPLYCGLSKSSPAKVCFTGILMVAANTMFSNLNNLMVCDIHTSGNVAARFSNMFGFTKEEVEELISKCRINGLNTPSLEELEDYYDGYVFGKFTHIFNPYSVMQALYNDELDYYWTATASGSSVIEFLEKSSSAFDLTNLLGLAYERTSTDQFHIHKTPDLTYGRPISKEEIYTVLYHCGYLTKTAHGSYDQGHVSGTSGGLQLATLRIPNQEIREVMKSKLFEIFFKTRTIVEPGDVFIRGFETRDFHEALDFIVKNTVLILSPRSFPKKEGESNYHTAFAMFMFHVYGRGRIAKSYRQFNEPTTGSGYADLICEIPMRQGEVLGVIFEFKYAEDESQMQQCATRGFNQIIDKNYTSHFVHAHNVCAVILLGVSCHKMKVAFCYQLATRTSGSGSFSLEAPQEGMYYFPLSMLSAISIDGEAEAN